MRSLIGVLWEEVTDFCLGALNRGLSLDFCNVMNIVSISKVSHPSNLSNFCPISLCNVLFKIIAKMIVNRFKKIIGKCIDEA